MNLVEQELLRKLATAMGSSFGSYYQGEVKVPARPYLPALMIFGEETNIVSQGTLKDRYKMKITIRAVIDIFEHFEDKGNVNGHNLILSSNTGTFVAGEVITGQTSTVTSMVTVGGTAFLVVGNWGATQTMVAGESILGASSGATGVISSVLYNGIIRAQYQLRELMEGRNSTTGLLNSNSVLGVLRNRANLRGTYYYFSENITIVYKTIQTGEVFYVAAEARIEAETDLITRPGY